MDPRFVEFKRGDLNANARHYEECLRENRPMMMIRQGRIYAELEWDCVTVSSETDPSNAHSTEIGHQMFDLFQQRAKGAPGKPIFYGSAFTGTVTKLLPGTARQLARDYYTLLVRARLRAAKG